MRQERIMDRRSWIAAAASIAVLAACGSGSSTGGLDAERTYAIDLTTAQVVPAPKPSSATGAALFIQYPERIDYEVGAQLIPGVTSVHIHSGAPGATGTQIVTLFSTTSPISPAGSFTSGSMHASNLPAGLTLESLKTLLASGNAYVDVHTTANPGGELRGQIK
jgi:hypothetical protein